jgi:hypothetical protein
MIGLGVRLYPPINYPSLFVYPLPSYLCKSSFLSFPCNLYSYGTSCNTYNSVAQLDWKRRRWDYLYLLLGHFEVIGLAWETSGQTDVRKRKISLSRVGPDRQIAYIARSFVGCRLEGSGRTCQIACAPANCSVTTLWSSSFLIRRKPYAVICADNGESMCMTLLLQHRFSQLV